MTEMGKHKVRELPGESILRGDLPQGCKLCAKGSKMVLFVTGLCDSSCYYCPLSSDKAGKDVVFADEIPVSDESDIIYEMRAIDAEGAGLSGGDPLCDIERTLRYINLLKLEGGKKFHLHLYTSKTDALPEDLQRLRNAGLDEIRFHPQGNDWSGISHAIEIGMVVGIEVPVIPNQFERLTKIAKKAEEIGVSFLNLNELESSETNFEHLVSKGMRLTSLENSSIQGSASTAREVVEWAAENLKRLTVHFCSARYKDAIQLRNRLDRRLSNIIRPFEERDGDDPLLILGVVRAPYRQQLTDDHLVFLYRKLRDTFEVPSDLMNIDEERKRIEIAPWILEEIADDLKRLFTYDQELEMGIVFEYPTYDRLQTLFEPL